MPALRSASSSPNSGALLGVVRARRIAGRGPDAAVLLGDQLALRRRSSGGVAPEFAPHALVQVLGERFGEPVGQRLQHDRVVVVVLRLERRDARLDAEPAVTAKAPM